MINFIIIKSLDMNITINVCVNIYLCICIILKVIFMSKHNL